MGPQQLSSLTTQRRCFGDVHSCLHHLNSQGKCWFHTEESMPGSATAYLWLRNLSGLMPYMMGNLLSAPDRQIRSSKYAKCNAGNMHERSSRAVSREWTQLSGLVALISHLGYTLSTPTATFRHTWGLKSGVESPTLGCWSYPSKWGRHCSQPCKDIHRCLIQFYF